MNTAPKVAAVHDLTGFGRCSLTVALPVLGPWAASAARCPRPTSLGPHGVSSLGAGVLSGHDRTAAADCGALG